MTYNPQQERTERMVIAFVRKNPVIQEYKDTKTVLHTKITYRKAKAPPGFQVIQFEATGWFATVRHNYDAIQNKWTCAFSGDHARFYSWLAMVQNFPAMCEGLRADPKSLLEAIDGVKDAHSSVVQEQDQNS